MKNPEITIVHSLPNRVRLRLALSVKRPDELIKVLCQCNGVRSASYSNISQTMLIHYDHMECEFLHILKVMVLELCSSYGYKPVIVRPEAHYSFTPLAFISAASIGFIGLAQFFMLFPTRVLNWACAGLTAAAVLEHAYNEFNESGSFDFENLSIVYLANSVNNGHFLKGSFFTWLATFSRHIMPVNPHDGLKLTVIEGEDYPSGRRYNDVITSGCININNFDGQQAHVRRFTLKDFAQIWQSKKVKGLK